VGKVKGDFGGISYQQGDFHTVGYSGIDVSTGDFVTNGTSGLGSMGFSLKEAFASVFGKDGAEAVKTSLQSGASNLATSVIGSKLASDPTAKQGVVDTAKATINQLYQEYKIPVIVVTGSLAALLAYGIYNAVKKK
jgi:hypothetical protein